MMTLSEQEALYEMRWAAVVTKLQRDLRSQTYLFKLHDLGLERLRAGFETYGEKMYGWDNEERRRNMDEELADFIVYGTSA